MHHTTCRTATATTYREREGGVGGGHRKHITRLPTTTKHRSACDCPCSPCPAPSLHRQGRHLAHPWEQRGGCQCQPRRTLEWTQRRMDPGTRQGPQRTGTEEEGDRQGQWRLSPCPHANHPLRWQGEPVLPGQWESLWQRMHQALLLAWQWHHARRHYHQTWTVGHHAYCQCRRPQTHRAGSDRCETPP